MMVRRPPDLDAPLDGRLYRLPREVETGSRPTIIRSDDVRVHLKFDVLEELNHHV